MKITQDGTIYHGGVFKTHAETEKPLEHLATPRKPPESTMAFNGDLVMQETQRFLLDLADRLDGWAQASRSGGWSTHQVDDNRKAADDCRRQAAAIRQILPRS